MNVASGPSGNQLGTDLPHYCTLELTLCELRTPPTGICCDKLKEKCIKKYLFFIEKPRFIYYILFI